MDVYSGYNQISMCYSDQEKIAFMTKPTSYQYNVIPFDLKNARETY